MFGLRMEGDEFRRGETNRPNLQSVGNLHFDEPLTISIPQTHVCGARTTLG